MNGPLWGNYVAGGTIRPRRFVNMDATADHTLLEADANEVVHGVVDERTKAHDSANHAESGDDVSLQSGHVLEVEAGGAITRGSRVKSDADGKAVTVATTGTTNQECPGVAMESASGDGAIIKMFWMPVVIQPEPT